MMMVVVVVVMVMMMTLCQGGARGRTVPRHAAAQPGRGSRALGRPDLREEGVPGDIDIVVTMSR